MPTFANTLNPTPFGFFNSESDFITEADNIVVFVKRKMGDDILSVELTKKQIWASLEESFLEYGSIVNQYQAKSQLLDFLGTVTGSLSGSEQKYPRETLEFLRRQAEPYAMEASTGGSYNEISGAIALVNGQQDYDMYADLMTTPGGTTTVVSTQAVGSRSKMKVQEVFHFSPSAAYRFFDSTSAINYLNNEFSFESFTPESIFYVLPVFEDIIRAGQMNVSQRVRRSNYSYRIQGTKIRIFPAPSTPPNAPGLKYLWLRVMVSPPDPLNPAYRDDTVHGVSNLSNVPFGNLQYDKVNSVGRQWVRQYTSALCKEILGLVRSKFATVPVPNAEVTLNGTELVSQAREEQTNLKTQLVEMLESLTYDKLIETKAASAASLQSHLRTIPIPNGLAITMG
tara:strand:- start:366 stop:1556 length:1191 start_codon:yes stop_codon:yes gene_type:complete